MEIFLTFFEGHISSFFFPATNIFKILSKPFPDFSIFLAFIMGGKVFSTPQPLYNFGLRDEIGDCNTWPVTCNFNGLTFLQIFKFDTF